jgi:hypothetical protein
MFDRLWSVEDIVVLIDRDQVRFSSESLLQSNRVTTGSRLRLRWRGDTSLDILRASFPGSQTSIIIAARPAATPRALGPKATAARPGDEGPTAQFVPE